MPTITEKLKELGYNVQFDSYRGKIDYWKNWWHGKDDRFHSYKFYNGTEYVYCERAQLKMAKRGTEKWADLIWNERCFITVEEPGGEPNLFKRFTRWVRNKLSKGNYQSQVTQVLEENNFTSMTNQHIDKSFGSGTGGILVYGEGKLPRIEYVDVDYIYPLAVRNGIVESCAFAGVEDNNNRYDTSDPKIIYIMIHLKNADGTYTVRNLFYGADENLNITKEIPTPAGIMPEEQTRVCRFAIIKPNIANNVDENSPFGMSIYANSIDILKNIDLAYDGIQQSMDIGRPRIAVKGEALKPTPDGEKMVFDSRDKVFYQLGPDASGQDDKLIQDITTQYRADSYENSLQVQLQVFAQSIGFGETTFKWNNTNVDTAYQALSIDSATARSMEKHQDGLNPQIVRVVRAVLDVLGLDPFVQIAVKFDDSVVINEAQEQQKAWGWVMAGEMAFWRYLVDFEDYGEDEAKRISAEAREAEDLKYEQQQKNDPDPPEE